MRYIKLLTLIALILFILLQGLWVFNLYKLISKHISQQIDEMIIVATTQELMHRRSLINDTTINKNEQVINEFITKIRTDLKGLELENPELIFQEFLAGQNLPVSLAVIDSIFIKETIKQSFDGEFIINLIDIESGEILQTTDLDCDGKMEGSMASIIVPIRMDGSEGVQVHWISPYRSIFKEMNVILILSSIKLLFIGYVSLFLLKSFIKEWRIRRLQNDFSNALIHDMATPLQTIMQIISMMRSDKIALDEVQRNKYIDIAQRQIINMQAITDRILTVARSEQSQLNTDIEVINLNEIINRLIDKFKVNAKKNIVFNTQFVPETVIFNADLTMLENAISNLIDNAIKYSSESVNINIKCSVNIDGLTIKVKDNGYGISEKDQLKIFAKFERGNAVARNEAKGFGIGLSYVKSIAEAHEGTVNLFSNKNEGTEFTIFIPYQDK